MRKKSIFFLVLLLSSNLTFISSMAPNVHAEGDANVLGNDSVEAVTIGTGHTLLSAHKFTASADAVIQSLKIYIFVAVDDLRLALYSHDTEYDRPGVLLAEADEQVSYTGWMLFDIADTEITNGSTYWIARQFESIDLDIKATALGGGGNCSFKTGWTYGDPFPNPFGGIDGSNDRLYSIYACGYLGDLDTVRTMPYTLWYTDTNEDNMEHSILKDGKLYVPALKGAGAPYTGGLWIINFTTGDVIQIISDNYFATTPVIDSTGAIHCYDHWNKKLVKMNESTGIVDISTGTPGANGLDFETMGWDSVDDVIIIPVDAGLRAYWALNHSTRWNSLFDMDASTATKRCSGPVVVGDFVYMKDNNAGILYKLDRKTGAYVANSTALGFDDSSYYCINYDADHDIVYTLGLEDEINAINASDMSLLWNVTTGAPFTDPELKYSSNYHNDSVYMLVREQSGDYETMIYALNYSDGTELWNNSFFYSTFPESVCVGLVDDDFLYVAGTDMSDANRRTGHIAQIHLFNGSIYANWTLNYAPSCGGITTGGGGLLAVAQLKGAFEVIRTQALNGTIGDVLHYGKNLYHTGYLVNYTGDWEAPASPPPAGNTAPTRGAYILDQFDAPDVISDGERNTRFWFSASDVDGYDTIDTLEFSIQVGTTWCNFSYDTNADGSGSWTKTTDQVYVEMFNDGWGGATSNYMMYAWIQVNPGAPDTYSIDVYQRITDTSSASSGWGQIYGTPFNIVEQGDEPGTTGTSGPSPYDGPPPDEPGDPDWWTDPDNLNAMSEDDLIVLAESLGVTVTASDTKADIIANILEKAEEEGFSPFEGCGLDEEAKLALLEYLLILSVQDLRLECQSLGISYKLWRDPEPYIILIFTVGYGCSPPDAFYEQGFFDPEDWDEDGVPNWDDPDMFDETRMGLGARVEADISSSLPWIQQNGYLLIILALFLAFMYSQVKKRDKPGSRGESLIRPGKRGYVPPGER